MRDNDPRSDILRSNRVRTYVAARAMSTECDGSSLYSLETYLIVDNATEGDAGTYLVNVTTPQYNEPETEQVNVTVGRLNSTVVYYYECNYFTGDSSMQFCLYTLPRKSMCNSKLGLPSCVVM